MLCLTVLSTERVIVGWNPQRTTSAFDITSTPFESKEEITLSGKKAMYGVEQDARDASPASPARRLSEWKTKPF
jgi:hypothetical protein